MEDRKQSNNKYYEQNKEDFRRRNQEFRARNREFVLAYKEGKACVDCGVNYPSYVMEFDHVRGVKIKDVSNMVRSNFSLVKIQEEIDKCDLVCANCHRERTFSRLREVPI